VKSRDVAERLRAYAEGRPLPSGATITVPIAEPEDRIVLSFVRMGGESLPWGIGYQLGEDPPVLLSAPDGRQRDPVGDMCAELSKVLCGFLGSPLLTGEAVDPDNPPPLPLRQIWVPNRSHIEMIHLLNLRYSRTQYGDPARSLILRALGRASGFLFRESEREGQATVIDASAVLRDHFVFPADDMRQQHLGFLLAMMNTDGSFDERMQAAEAAEEFSVSHTLTPELERDELSPLVEAFNKAEGDGGAEVQAAASAAVGEIIDAENRRRIDLVNESIALLMKDARQENKGAAELAEDSIRERDCYYRWQETTGALDGDVLPHLTTSALTDGVPASASKRYYRMLAASDKASVCLLHDDPELQKVAVAEGDAIKGTLAAVSRAPSLKSDSDTEVEVWRVEASASLPSRIREGAKLCLAGSPDHDCIVTEVAVDGETRVLSIEPDKKLAGSLQVEADVLLLPASVAFFGIKKGKEAKNSDGPGAWLTHAQPGRPRRRGLNGPDVLERVEELRGS